MCTLCALCSQSAHKVQILFFRFFTQIWFVSWTRCDPKGIMSFRSIILVQNLCLHWIASQGEVVQNVFIPNECCLQSKVWFWILLAVSLLNQFRVDILCTIIFRCRSFCSRHFAGVCYHSPILDRIPTCLAPWPILWLQLQIWWQQSRRWAFLYCLSSLADFIGESWSLSRIPGLVETHVCPLVTNKS